MMIEKPMTVRVGGMESCNLVFDMSIKVAPMSPREQVGNTMLMLKDASLGDLVRITGLPEEVILREIKGLKKEFGVRGSRKKYSLSDNTDERLALSKAITAMTESRIVTFLR